MRVVLDIRDDDPKFVAQIARLHLNAVVLQNRAILRRAGGAIPKLYESGVRFRNEPWAGKFEFEGEPVQGIEEFCTLSVVLQRGWGDCAQLCAWRVSELVEEAISKGVPPRKAAFMFGLRIYWRISGVGTPKERRFFHVQVRHPKAPGQRFGRIEDPSRLLEY